RQDRFLNGELVEELGPAKWALSVDDPFGVLALSRPPVAASVQFCQSGQRKGSESKPARPLLLVRTEQACRIANTRSRISPRKRDFVAAVMQRLAQTAQNFYSATVSASDHVLELAACFGLGAGYSCHLWHRSIRPGNPMR